jgi:hypothetical protein
MARYIDADKLVLWCNETYQVQSTVTGKAYVNDFLTKVLSCPTENVAPIADTVKKIKEKVYEVVQCLDEVDAFFLKEMIDQIEKEVLEGEQNDYRTIN